MKSKNIADNNNYSTLCYYRIFDESKVKEVSGYKGSKHSLFEVDSTWDKNIREIFYAETIDFELFYKDDETGTIRRTTFKYNHGREVQNPLFSFEICESSDQFIRFFFLEFKAFVNKTTEKGRSFETDHEAKHIETISRQKFLDRVDASEDNKKLIKNILSDLQPSCSNACKLSSFSAWNHIEKIHYNSFTVPHETILCQEYEGMIWNRIRCHAIDIKTEHKKDHPLYPNYQTFTFPVEHVINTTKNFLTAISDKDDLISGIIWDETLHFNANDTKHELIIIYLSIILLLIYSASIPIFNHMLKRQPISPLSKSYFEKITLDNPIPEDNGSTCFTLPGKHQYFTDANYEKLISEKIRLKLINTRPIYDFKRSKSVEKETTNMTEVTEIENSTLTQSKVSYNVVTCSDELSDQTQYLPLLSQKLTLIAGSTDFIREKLRPFAKNELLIYQILNSKFNDLVVELDRADRNYIFHSKNFIFVSNFFSLKGYYFKEHFTMLVMKEYTDARRYLRNSTSDDPVRTRLLLTRNALKILLMLFDCTKAVNDYFYPFLALPRFLTKRKRIVHNDIKLENFFVDTSQEQVSLKIGDFGDSRITTDFLDFELDIKNLMKVLHIPVDTTSFSTNDQQSSSISFWQGYEENHAFKSIIKPLIESVSNTKFIRKNEKQLEKDITAAFEKAIQQCDTLSSSTNELQMGLNFGTNDLDNT